MRVVIAVILLLVAGCAAAPASRPTMHEPGFDAYCKANPGKGSCP